MRTFVALVAALSLPACLLENPAYGDESGAATAALTTDALTTAVTTASTTEQTSTAQTTADPSAGSGSDSATAGATTDAATTDAATTDPGAGSSTGCPEEQAYVDNDKDGHGAGEPVTICVGTRGHAPIGDDCDDNNVEVHPGTDELCDDNKLDEDCDGLKNEYSASNTACDGCALGEYGGHSYWFCSEVDDWQTHRGTCQSFGPVDLTMIGDAQEDAYVYSMRQGPTMWIGGFDHDPGAPLDYRWLDGSPLTYTNWYGPNPDFNNGYIVIMANVGGQWRDRDGGEPHGYTCESL